MDGGAEGSMRKQKRGGKARWGRCVVMDCHGKQRGMSGEEWEQGAVTIKHAALGWVQQRLSIVGTDRRSACVWVHRDAGCLGWDASTRSRRTRGTDRGTDLRNKKAIKTETGECLSVHKPQSATNQRRNQRVWPGKRAPMQPGVFGCLCFLSHSCKAAKLLVLGGFNF